VEPDVLGAPYQCQVIDLGHDDEGPVVATLVSRRTQAPTGRAVLYVHGFVDYFFQTHLAEFFTDRGWDFYALDLRKYGRSLQPHQTPNFCRSLTDYYEELDEAARIIREEHGNRTLLVIGHSTGGLITSLWTHDRRADGLVDGLFLNSPFFDLNASWFVRRPVVATVTRMGRGTPYRIIPLNVTPVYGQTLHAEQRGEWTYNLAWKPLLGFPVRVGWLHAIRQAQRRLRAGLAIPVPTLLACSERSFRGPRWHESAALADAVLDVEHIVRWAPRLGRHVTVVRFDGGMHDLLLSGPAVREQVFFELDRWLGAYLPHRGPESGADEPTATGPAVSAADQGGTASVQPSVEPA
jgi:alpha-beta hydrolase superfamily lysophospholipase